MLWWLVGCTAIVVCSIWFDNHLVSCKQLLPTQLGKAAAAAAAVDVLWLP